MLVFQTTTHHIHRWKLFFSISLNWYSWVLIDFLISFKKDSPFCIVFSFLFIILVLHSLIILFDNCYPLQWLSFDHVLPCVSWVIPWVHPALRAEDPATHWLSCLLSRFVWFCVPRLLWRQLLRKNLSIKYVSVQFYTTIHRGKEDMCLGLSP
jgi:hypothetical protein